MRFLLLSLIVFLAGCRSTPEASSPYKKSSPTEGLVDLHDAAKEKPVVVPTAPLPPVKTASVENQITGKASNSDKAVDDLEKALAKQDEYQIAVQARQVLIQNPSDAKALNALALYHFRKGEFGAAQAILTKAIGIHPKLSMLHSNLGLILQTQGRLSEAVQAYREALKVDSSNAVAAANLGAYYTEVRDFSKAQVALEIAVQKGQRDWRTLSNYGLTLMALGKYPSSDMHFKKALELQPQNAELMLNYATLLVEFSKKPAEGLDILNKIRFMGPGPDLRKRISELENKAKSLK
jgi:Flp pilus assembly protein TadD